MARIRPPFKRTYDPLGDTTDSEFDPQPLPPDEDAEDTGTGWGWATTFPEPTFCVPFADKGGGEVNTADTFGGATPTFTRAGATATTVLANGLVSPVIGANIPRSYYDPSSGEYLGYLAEGARTNLVLSSADLRSNAAGNPVVAWTNTDSTVTVAGTTSPDGTNTGNLITEGSAGTATITQSVAITADVSTAFSRWFKYGNTPWVRINVSDGTNLYRVYVNIQTGTLGTAAASGVGATVGTPTIKAYPNGWYRVDLSGVVANGATSVGIQTASALANNDSTRVANSTRYEWGAQFENNVSFASSYIPTVGTTVARNADILTYSKVIMAFGTASGAWFYQYQVFDVADAGRKTLSADDLGGNTRWDVRGDSDNATTAAVAYGTGAAVITHSVGAVAANTTNKLALSYGSTGVSGSLNGAAVVSNSTPSNLNATSVIGIGCNGSSSAVNLFGTIRRVAHWQGNNLADNDLVYLTRANSPF